MYYKDHTPEIASLLKIAGVKINSFSEAGWDVDGEIEVDVPNRQICIQICPYYPEHGLVVDEVIGTGEGTRIATLETFGLSKNGVRLMASFIKELQ